MEIIKKTLVVLVLCSFIMGTVPISVLAQQNSPDNQIFEYEGPDLPDGVEYVPGELIVKFEPGVSNNEIANINSKHGTSVKYTSPYAGFKILHIPKGKTVPEMVEKYSKNPNVEYAEPNYIAYASMVPDDPLYSPYQWHFDNPEYGGINMEEAWDISSGAGAGVIVAVLDTGVAYENYEEVHPRVPWRTISYAKAPDLAGTNFVQGYDFVNDDDHPNDDEGHGTHVTGTIAQTTNNKVGVAGIAYNATIMPVKVLDSRGSGSYYWIADGIRYATDNDAKVISMSLGGSSPSITLENALSYAYGKGVTIICSSGNEGSDTTISYPAAYDAYCIAVGATRYDEEVTYYSNGGTSLDLTAPGGDLSVDQNGDQNGDGIVQQTHDGSDYTNFGYYLYMGTSMAAPHVSGVAALLISEGVANTPDEVREVLQSTAEDKGTPGWDSEYGWGIVDAYAALTYASTPNTPPTADPNGPYSGTEGASVSFNGSGSTDDGIIVSYDWNFGDRAIGTGIYPDHNYIDNGTYTVTLTVTDNDGVTNTSTTTATIDNVAPLANAGGPYSGSVNISITFSGNATDPGTADVLTYDWDFDYDGTVNASGIGLANPSHTYISAGTYTVALQVKDGDGGISPISTANVTVTAPDTEDPVILGATGNTTGKTGEPVTITAIITDNVDVASAAVYYTPIDAAEETVAMTEDINNVWSADIPVASDKVGTITYYITALDAAANTAIDPFSGTYSINVTDNGDPIAEAGPNQTVLVDEVVTFNGSDSSDNIGITGYTWAFGDEGTKDSMVTSHAYNTVGTYTVTLTVTDIAGNTDSDTLTVNVIEEADTIHIANIDMSTDTKSAGRNDFTWATATVTIVDSTGTHVEGAQVTGNWSELTSDTDEGITESDGTVTLHSDSEKNLDSGTFTFTVTSVYLAGWTYNPSDNAEYYQGSITVPE